MLFVFFTKFLGNSEPAIGFSFKNYAEYMYISRYLDRFWPQNGLKQGFSRGLALSPLLKMPQEAPKIIVGSFYRHFMAKQAVSPKMPQIPGIQRGPLTAYFANLDN